VPKICNSLTVVIFTQKNTCTVTGYLYNGNHIKVIHINYMRVINMFVYIVYFGQSESSPFSVNAVFKERGDAKNRVELLERSGMYAYVQTEQVQ
jgi:hypothetical protein